MSSDKKLWVTESLSLLLRMMHKFLELGKLSDKSSNFVASLSGFFKSFLRNFKLLNDRRFSGFRWCAPF